MHQKGTQVAVFIVLMSVLFSLGYFRGLEHHTSVFGNAYQALHPSSFPADPDMSPARPTMLTLLYHVIVPLFGPLWLDDRVCLFVFVGIAIGAFVGLDRLARALGVKQAWERIAILSLMLFDHPFLTDYRPMLIDSLEFNSTTFAGPLVVWLLALSLAGARPMWILLFIGLSVLMSIKVSWMPALIALVLLWQERLGKRGKLVALGGAVGLVSIATGSYYLLLRPADGSHVLLFDWLHHVSDAAETNPFMSPLLNNVLFAAFCLVGFAFRRFRPVILRRLRTVACIGLIIWLVGGLYYSYAPDGMKIPYLVVLDVTRALVWPQLVLYTAAGVVLLKQIQTAPSSGRFVIALLLFLALFLNRFSVRMELVAIVLVSTVGLLFVAWQRSRAQAGGSGRGAWSRRLTPQARLTVVAVVLVLANVGQIVRGIEKRREALTHLARYGVMGDNGAAKWVGVNAYIREHTLPTDTVLALSVNTPSGIQRAVEPRGLEFDGSLRIRTGRSMPLGHYTSTFFDYQKLQRWEEREQILTELCSAIERRSIPRTLERLAAIGQPDVLVAPAAHVSWLLEHSEFPYRFDVSIGEFTILRRHPTRL